MINYNQTVAGPEWCHGHIQYIDYEEESGAISVMLYMYIRNIVKFNFCIFIDKT